MESRITISAKLRMSLTAVAVTVLAFTASSAVDAQVGPCGAADACASGQICRGAAGSRYCFISCTSTDTLGASAECPASQSCLRPEGFDREVCVDLAGATSEGLSGISTATTCNDARPCPSGLTCTEGTCRQPLNGPCSSDADCAPTVRCVGDRITGRTCSGSPSSASTTEEPEEAPFEPITPSLGVPLPGYTPEAPTREGTIVRVAFLAGYINAVYRYLTAIVLVISIVMVVYGGFLYLVGSAGIGSIQRGKSIITNAVMGMIITLAAYSILNIVNPSTTQLKTLELGYIAGEVIFEPGGIDYGEAPAESASGSCDAPRRGSSDTTYDSLFQRYAPCAGLDWRILKAVAFKESAFRECVTNRYGFTGLFQVRPDTCALRRFGRESDCNRLVNPEINTAAAAVGQLRSGADFINRLCPGLSDARRYVTFLYFAHNSGSGNLQSVIREAGCNASDETYDRVSTQVWEELSERRGRSLPPNHDSRMRYARTVADLAVSYGVSSPTVPRSSCPVH